MPQLYLIGVDGSGKTTLSQRLVERLRTDGWRTDRFYGRYYPMLLLPFKIIARLFMRGTDANADYDGYLEKKHTHVAKRSRMTRLYAWIWLLDYTLVTLARMASRQEPEVRIFDRYYLDMLVYVAVALNLDDETLLRWAERLKRYFPQPDLCFFLDLPSEVAFARKDDIPSVRYLDEHRRRYQLFAKTYGFITIDATMPLDVLIEEFAAMMPPKKSRVYA